jgi:hypothetical protein
LSRYCPRANLANRIGPLMKALGFGSPPPNQDPHPSPLLLSERMKGPHRSRAVKSQRIDLPLGQTGNGGFRQPRYSCGQALQRYHLFTSPAMLPSSIGWASRCATSRTVHPANFPAEYGWGFASIARCLGLSVASGRCMGALHGVGAIFHCVLPPA